MQDLLLGNKFLFLQSFLGYLFLLCNDQRIYIYTLQFSIIVCIMKHVQ